MPSNSFSGIVSVYYGNADPGRPPKNGTAPMSKSLKHNSPQVAREASTACPRRAASEQRRHRDVSKSAEGAGQQLTLCRTQRAPLESSKQIWAVVFPCPCRRRRGATAWEKKLKQQAGNLTCGSTKHSPASSVPNSSCTTKYDSGLVV